MRSLLALSAALALMAPAAAKTATVVPVHFYSFGYAPSPIVLTAGRPATMLFSNRSGQGHTFKAPRFFASARVISGEIHGGEIHLGAGQTQSVTLVPAHGTFKVHCSHFMHDQLGMNAWLYVR